MTDDPHSGSEVSRPDEADADGEHSTHIGDIAELAADAGSTDGGDERERTYPGSASTPERRPTSSDELATFEPEDDPDPVREQVDAELAPAQARADEGWGGNDSVPMSLEAKWERQREIAQSGHDRSMERRASEEASGE